MEDFKCPLLDKNLINPITVSIPKFTLIGATTHGGMIKGPLIGRFQYKGYLIDYNNEQLSGMAKNACRRIYGLDLPDTTALKMASTCKRTARNVYSMLRNLIDVAESDIRGMVFGEHLTPSMLLKTLKMERIDPYVGLDPISRKYLTVLLRENTTLGSRTIANMINEQEITVVYMIEPFLTSEIALEFKSNNMPKIINGPFVRITPKGRVITEAGRTYLSICRNLQHSGWFTGENLGNLENVYENTY
jgi:Holliday junction DNA helicase RuvB